MSEPLSSVTTIREILLAQFPSLEPTNLANHVPLSDQIGLDSMGIIQLCLELEQIFEIQLDGDYLAPEHFETINAIAQLVDMVKHE